MLERPRRPLNFPAACMMPGFTLPPVGFPTVPEGKARLRAMVTATHKRADLERACEIIAEVGRGLGLV